MSRGRRVEWLHQSVCGDAANSADRRSYKVSFDRIRDRLGFEPRFSVDSTIDEVAGLLDSGAVSDFTEERYHNAKWLGASAHARSAA